MPNLIDKLINKVDAVRQKAANKFGLPSFDFYRVFRTWSGGERGSGTITDVATLLTPTPEITFSGLYRLDSDGLMDERKAKVKGISLSFQENFITGDPKTGAQESFFKMVERNGQGQDTTYWTLDTPPFANRSEVYWELELSHYVVC